MVRKAAFGVNPICREWRLVGVSGILRLACAAAALAAAGCSTVIKTKAADDAAGAAERSALVEAAATTAWAPWPKPSSSSLAERLAGGEKETVRVSRAEAVDAYVEQLSAMDDAQGALISDAGRHLQAMASLKAAAETAFEGANARLSDVALIEDAISDLRETRSVYVAALKKIDGEKEIVSRLKRDFDDGIKALGDVADDLAESAVKRRTENYAGPESKSVAAGSS